MKGQRVTLWEERENLDKQGFSKEMTFNVRPTGLKEASHGRR